MPVYGLTEEKTRSAKYDVRNAVHRIIGYTQVAAGRRFYD